MHTHKDETGEWIEKKGSKGAIFTGKYLFITLPVPLSFFIRIKGEVNISCAYMIQITGEKESWLCDMQTTKALNISAGWERLWKLKNFFNGYLLLFY
jgi:hypothetical protein